MILLQLLPVALSLLVLAAHFLRAGNILMLGLVLVLLALLGVRRRWAAQAVQAALVLGAAEWVRTLLGLVASRSQDGQPVLRLCIILGIVASVTALSALVFRTARLRRWYRSGTSAGSIGAC